MAQEWQRSAGIRGIGCGAEQLFYAAIRKRGLGLRERILSRPDLLGEFGCAFPRMANAALEFTPLRTLMEKTIGLSAKRSLPKYASERFDRWFATRSSRPEQSEVEGSRGSYLKAY